MSETATALAPLASTLPNRFVHRARFHRLEHPAFVIDSFVDFEAKLPRNLGRGLGGKVEPVEVKPVLPRDGKGVRKTTGGDQGDVGEFPLDDRVGHEGRAVDQIVHVGTMQDPTARSAERSPATRSSEREGTLAIRVPAGPRQTATTSVNVPPTSTPTCQPPGHDGQNSVSIHSSFENRNFFLYFGNNSGDVLRQRQVTDRSSSCSSSSWMTCSRAAAALFMATEKCG